MGIVDLRWNRIIIIALMLFSIALGGCSTPHEVKGGGTIIGNPTIPPLPVAPKNPEENKDIPPKHKQKMVAKVKEKRFLSAIFIAEFLETIQSLHIEIQKDLK